MIKISCLFLIFLTFCYHIECQQNKANLDDLVNNVFKTTPSVGGQNNNPSPKPSPGGPAAPVDEEPYEPTYEDCGNQKICVPFYNCNNETNLIVTDGANLLDIRFDDTKPCPSYLETCCALEQKSTDDHPVPPPLEDVNNACGKRNADGLNFKITGGVESEAEYGEFPWMIAVLKNEKIGNEIISIYQCGGSMIHPSVVLTGAHCVYKHNAHDLIVRAGEWDTQTKNEMYPEQDQQVIEIVLHELFAKGGLHNNVALLFTQEPFSLSQDANTVCLPPPHMNFDHSRCFATGWGKDKFGQKGKYQVIMKKIDLPVVPNDVCQAKLRKTRLGKFFVLHDSFICAGGEPGKDTCKGDGGGPLVCPIQGTKDRYYQTGIVSWGIDCGTTNPGVYASVPYLREWIDRVMQSRNFETKYYTPK